LIKRYTLTEAVQKAKLYCRYQERSHFEVTTRLYNLGLFRTDVEKALVQLIEEGYLNEQRFANHFVTGKFRSRQWGRIKIIHALKQKRIGPAILQEALKGIDEEEYLGVLQKLAEEKWAMVNEASYFTKLAKTTHYLLQKGYEADRISKIIAAFPRNANQ